ncbi:MAG: HPP family protein [Reyranellaceae bacterium]
MSDGRHSQEERAQDKQERRRQTVAELRARRDPKRWTFARIVVASIGGGIAIAAVTYLSLLTDQILLMAPLGSSCALVFVAPWSEFAQPRNVIGGHVVSAIVGLAAWHLLGTDPWVSALAVTISIVAMQVTRTLHPPGAAIPLLVVQAQSDWWFVFTPVLAGAAIIVVVAVVYCRLTRVYPYPTRWI